MVWEEFGDQRNWHNDKTRPCLRHKIRGAPGVQWHEKTVHPATKIPDQARLNETDRAKLHGWSQVISRLSKKFVCRKESCDQRRNDKSERKIGQSRCSRAIP